MATPTTALLTAAPLATEQAEEREELRVQSKLHQDSANEQKRDAYFAQRAEDLADRREDKEHRQRVKLEQVERVRRVRAWEALELERKNQEEDAVYFHQKEELERMREARMRANHIRAAAQADTMHGLSTVTAPGPQDIDNRFFQTGTRSLAGGRNAPHYTFGSISETAKPRYWPGAEVELMGQVSPGPGTATHDISSVGGQLEKTTFARKVPAYGFGKPTNDRVKPRVVETSGPADTVVDKRAYEFTRMRRTPACSFASPTDTELFKSSTAASMHGLVGLLHPSRTPGPTSYSLKSLGMTEANAGTLVQSRSSHEFSFGKTKRFLSRESSSKGPGPQQYNPSKSFCSAGLAF